MSQLLDMQGKPLLLSEQRTAKKKPKKIIVQESGAILLSAECIFPEIFMKEKGSGLRRPSQEVAYCRADYDGFHWWRKWFYVQEKPLPSALGEELDEFVNGLFELPEFCSLESVKHSICSQVQPVSETEFNLYSETEHFWIWVRMQTQPRDYNLWIHLDILVREYRCSGGTDTASPAAGNRCSGTEIPHLIDCYLRVHSLKAGSNPYTSRIDR